jgi:hypothetical protein
MHVTLFHGTSSNHLASIQEQGLLPQPRPPVDTFWSVGLPDRCYLTPDREKAEYYSEVATMLAHLRPPLPGEQAIIEFSIPREFYNEHCQKAVVGIAFETPIPAQFISDHWTE